MCGITVCCLGVVAFLNATPYLWFLLLPVCGLFWGISIFSRLSMVLLLSALCSYILPRRLRKLFPLVDGVVLLSVLVVPFDFIPEWSIQLYLTFLWLLEPVFLLAETLQTVFLIRRSGNFFVEQINDNTTTWKSIVLMWSLICWVLAAMITIFILFSDDYWLAWALLVFNIVAHIVTYEVDEGIISDAASLFLTSMFTLWLGAGEKSLAKVVCDTSARPVGGASQSLIRFFLDLPSAVSESPQRMMFQMKQLFSPSFWTGIVMRVSTLCSLTYKLLRKQDEEEDEGAPNRWALIRVIAVLAYTQGQWRHLQGCRFITVKFGRRLQAFTMVFSYLWSLRETSDSSRSDF